MTARCRRCTRVHTILGDPVRCPGVTCLCGAWVPRPPEFRTGGIFVSTGSDVASVDLGSTDDPPPWGDVPSVEVIAGEGWPEGTRITRDADGNYTARLPPVGSGSPGPVQVVYADSMRYEIDGKPVPDDYVGSPAWVEAQLAELKGGE